MLETLLAKLGLPFLISSISIALGKLDNDIARKASDSLKQVENAIVTGNITIEQTTEANRHIERLISMETEKLREINASLRTEIESQDPYVRRMRPTFGYLMAFTWAAQMFAVAIWAVGLSVLGIYVYKRSEDKKLA
jgi:phosphoglycerate-specific signal transduction histidine kinase